MTLLRSVLPHFQRKPVSWPQRGTSQSTGRVLTSFGHKAQISTDPLSPSPQCHTAATLREAGVWAEPGPDWETDRRLPESWFPTRHCGSQWYLAVLCDISLPVCSVISLGAGGGFSGWPLRLQTLPEMSLSDIQPSIARCRDISTALENKLYRWHQNAVEQLLTLQCVLYLCTDWYDVSKRGGALLVL